MSEELKTVETMDREPFKHMVATIGNLPTSFVDSMSYYECLAWLCNYIQKSVIPVVNNNAEAVVELQNAWIELKEFCDNYFTSLNVQTEINNKLDDMADSGELAEIINEQIFTELNGKVDDNTTAIAGLQEDLSDLETELLHSRAIVKDSEYDTLADAFSDCLTNGYVLYLTTNHTLPATGVEFPDIIGNGFTITISNADSSTLIENTASNKVISNVKFVASSLYARDCFYEIADGVVERCEFVGFLTPIRTTGTNNTVIRDCIMKNCAKSVYVKDSTNVLIDNCSLINTNAQKSAITTLLSTVAGQDGVLIEGSKNIKITNSYFEYCIERALYSNESDDVIFSNNTITYSKGVKFVGMTAIHHGFVCEGNLLHNSLDDAFCQLYECDGCEVNNNTVMNDTDSYYVGWFIRAGHNLTNISVKGNYAKNIRRQFFSYEDTFPVEISTTNYNFKWIDISDNTGLAISMISGTLQQAINYTLNASADTHDNSQITIRNNTFYAKQFSGDSTFADDSWNYCFSTGIHLENCRHLSIANNDIRGIKDADKKLPAVELIGCSLTTIDETYYYNSTIGQITMTAPANVMGNINVLCNTGDHADKMCLQLSKLGSFAGTFQTTFVNKACWITLPNTWNLNLEVLNVDEISKLWNFGTTTAVSGERTSTTDVSTANVVCYVGNYSSTHNMIRCRTVRNLNIQGSVEIFPAS